MNYIEQNLRRIRQQIDMVAQSCGRNPQHINLLAVSKTKPIEFIKTAIKAGQYSFGENYVQEGVKKINWFQQAKLKDASLTWHFIGLLQSNKTRLVAENFDWYHTLDRPQLAQRLNNQRSLQKKPLNVLIQINISNENTKNGIIPEQMLSLATFITNCPRLKLRGLMAIPKPESNFNRQLETFKNMYMLYKKLQRFYPFVDTLSLGMTNDMSAAIIAGSNLLRIGTAIFGNRS